MISHDRSRPLDLLQNNTQIQRERHREIDRLLFKLWIDIVRVDKLWYTPCTKTSSENRLPLFTFFLFCCVCLLISSLSFASHPIPPCCSLSSRVIYFDTEPEKIPLPRCRKLLQLIYHIIVSIVVCGDDANSLFFFSAHRHHTHRS